MTLMQDDDFDNGIQIAPKEVAEVLGNIKVATFVLQNPIQYFDQTFFCLGSDGVSSSNKAEIKSASGLDYYISEWSQWARCNDMKDKESTYRIRRKADGNEVLQSRYCRCSDLKELPSPRFVHSNIMIYFCKHLHTNFFT